ncbi:MAG: EAL domain-containing protein [Candidatus Coproplasma sp.]
MSAELLATYNVKLQNLVYCSADFCAIVINILVIANYTINKKIKNRTSKLYYALTFISLITAVFNTLAILVSVVPMPIVLVKLFQLLFYISFNTAGLVFFAYTVSMIYGSNAKLPGLFKLSFLILSLIMCAGWIISAITFYTPANINKIVYEAMVYGGQIATTVCTLIVAIIKRHSLKFTQSANVYVFMVLNIVACLIQWFYTQAQVCPFALSVAVMLIYVTLQHPEEEVDHITGMFNMRSYEYRTNERLSSGKPFFVFAYEINNMAVINTSFGINGGNKVLKEMAERVRAILPENRFLHRLGGARFAVNFSTENEYKSFQKEFVKAFDAPVSVESTQIRLSATACVIAMPSVTDSVSDVEEILKYYRTGAKSADSVNMADKEAVEFSRRRERVEYAIDYALKNRTFEVYYQPIYSVKEKRINSCEALLRLKDPEIGFIGPDEFIPIAEETGKIVDVERFVMEEVCRFIRDDKPQQYGIDVIDVNLSVIQFMRAEVIDDIDSVLREYGIPRKMVNLEITETASAKSYAMLQSRLCELRDSGYTISLDDFGTGFSSVEYLTKFPFDIVKLDKSIVWAYMSTDKYQPILKHYMPMLHSLGMKIVAEGVETEQMLKALEELGCDYIQGYYFSRPIPKDAFISYIIKASQDIETA